MSTESIAEQLLEISSNQRINIILNLNQKSSKISEMAKILGATMPEVHRNFGRLEKAGMISKKSDGSFALTTYGKLVCEIFPLVGFISKNKSYFQNHNFGNIPPKFIQRIGSLDRTELISGYVKVVDKWQSIYENAQNYIKNILVEVSYTQDLIKTLLEKLNSNVKVSSLFAEDAHVSKDREELIKKQQFKKFIQNDSLKRKMKKGISVAVVLNEKEAGVCFPQSNGEIDLAKMFFGNSESFHEWCLDYFKYLWEQADSFKESKLKK